MELKRSNSNSAITKLLTWNIHRTYSYCIWFGPVRMTSNVVSVHPEVDLNFLHQVDGYIVGGLFASQNWIKRGKTGEAINKYLDKLRSREVKMNNENLQQKIKKLLGEVEKLKEDFITGEKNKIVTWAISNGFVLDREKSIEESCDVFLKNINPYVYFELDVEHPETENLLHFTILVNGEPYEDEGFESVEDLDKFYEEVEIPKLYTVDISFKTVQSNQEQAENIARGFANRLLNDPDVCLSTVKQHVEEVK